MFTFQSPQNVHPSLVHPGVGDDGAVHPHAGGHGVGVARTIRRRVQKGDKRRVAKLHPFQILLGESSPPLIGPYLLRRTAQDDVSDRPAKRGVQFALDVEFSGHFGRRTPCQPRGHQSGRCIPHILTPMQDVVQGPGG